MVFRSSDPDIEVPTDITVWDWLFDSDSPHSPINNYATASIAGYTNAVTRERISYAQVKKFTTYLSTALVKIYGLKPGDTVALFSQNTIWYPVALLAVSRAGGIISGASPAYNVEEMTYALKTGNAKFLMTLPGSMGVAVEAAKNAGIPQSRVLLLAGQVDGYTSMRELLNTGKSFGENGQVGSWKIPQGKTNFDICGFLSFSSGTTELPKAVMIAHHNIIGQCLQASKYTSDDHRKVLAVLPMFHITGLVHQLHLPILMNAEVYMLPSFSMKSMLDAVTTFKILELLLVPPILIRLVRDPVVDNYDLSHVKRFTSGAAPLSVEIINLLEAKFPHAGLRQAYGMTETTSCVTMHPTYTTGYKNAFRVGTLVPNTEVKIVDPATGRECSYNEPGELLVRGPQVTMGYLNNLKATAETYETDGFMHTGDVGKVEKDGFITITDRIKEMIKVKGIAVAPAEIEDLLLGHPDVEDVACLGINDDYAGERPKVYVVLKPVLRGRERELARKLFAYVREKKVRHKWIVEIEFTSEIPKSASGKIVRRVLRDLERDKKRNKVVYADEARARL